MFKFNQLCFRRMIELSRQKLMKISLPNEKSGSNIQRVLYKNFCNKENYKEKFKTFAKDQNITPDEVKRKKDEEEKKFKENLEDAKRKYEEESQRKKELFEKIKKNEPIDNLDKKSNNDKTTIEIDISLSSLKNKFSSVFSRKGNTTDQPAEEKKQEPKIENDNTTSTKQDAFDNVKEEIKSGTSENNESTQKINQGTGGNKSESKEEQKQEGIPNEEKKPSFGKRFITGFIDVWHKTFPGEENIQNRFERRKEEARILKEKIKDATEEEIQQAEEAIPEWKRGALVLIVEEVKEVENIFDKARNTIKKHIRNSEVYQNFRDSDAYKELEQIKLDYKEARKNLRDELSASQNPFIVVSRDLMDKVQFKSSTSYCVSLIRKIDPDFDLFEFEKEVDLIFKDFMEAFLKDDLEHLERISSSTALGLMTGVIKTRKELKAHSKYKELIWVDKAQFISASLQAEADSPVFRFRISCQEINCLVNKETGKVVQGDENQVESCQYNVDLARNSNPEVDIVGHPWQIINLERIGVFKQLV